MSADAYSPFWPWSPEEMAAIREAIKWRADNDPSTSEGESEHELDGQRP